MNDPAHVPQLGNDSPAVLMDAVGDDLPAFDLRIVPKGPARSASRVLRG
jgi:hypothetical protein